MSYDIYLTINTGKEEVAIIDVGNYTSNIYGMYYEAFRRDWKFINGMVAGEALPDIKDAIKHMEKHPDKFKAMNPKNGWGDYEGALQYLKDLANYCEQNPICKIDISY